MTKDTLQVGFEDTLSGTVNVISCDWFIYIVVRFTIELFQPLSDEG